MKFLFVTAILVAVIVAIVVFAINMGSMKTEDARACLDEFMLAGKAQDLEAAYALWLPKASWNRGEVEGYIEDNYVTRFKYYDSVDVTTWDVEKYFLWKKNNGTLTGDIVYSDSSKVPFEADIVTENGSFLLKDLDIGY